MPREKLINLGVKSLSNSELLANIFVSGTRSESVFALVDRLIDDYGLNDFKLLDSVNILQVNYDLSLVKSCQLVATLELGRRLFEKKPLSQQLQINNPKKLANEFSYLASKQQEELRVIFVNAQNFYIGHELISIGTSNQLLISNRDILRKAILSGAMGIIIIHNHPSGLTNPSSADIDSTKLLKQACIQIGIELIDHIIIGDGYFSFYENSIMT